MRKVLNPFLCVLVCLCVFLNSFAVTSYAAASSGFVDYYIEDWEHVPDDLSELIKAYQAYCRSEGLSDYFSNISNIPKSWAKFSVDLGFAISPVPNVFYYLGEDGSLWRDDTEASHPGGSSTHGKHRAGSGDLVLPSQTLKDIIDTDTSYSPKTTSNKISYRSEAYFLTGDNLLSSRSPALTLYDITRGGFLTGKSVIYMLPFYTDGTNSYYNRYQLRFSLVTSGKNEHGNTLITLTLDCFDLFSNDINTSIQTVELGQFDSTSLYIHLTALEGDFLRFWFYSSILNYMNRSAGNGFSGPRLENSEFYYLSSNLQSYVDVYRGNLASSFCKNYTTHNSNSIYGDSDDIGYFYSSNFISVAHNVDTSRIPDDQNITINGNVIYDWSITNPETGETTTINNFIENNYYYGDGNGSGSGSGGSVGCDVNVGGNVSVDGNINVGGEVDINVNVNVNGGYNGGSGGSDGSFDYPDTDLIDNLPEAPQGFLAYLTVLFDFLPPSVLALIVGGIAAAIFCRIWGR